MKLSERLKVLEEQKEDAGSPRAEAITPAPGPVRGITGDDPLAGFKQRAQEALFSRLGARIYDSSLTEEQLHAVVVEELDRLLVKADAPLSEVERKQLVADITDDVLGYGPVEEFLADPAVTEVMVNSDRSIFVEREGRLHRTNAKFLSEGHLRRVIERIVSEVGRRIDESSPMVDARLPDGSRVNAIIPPLAVDGPALTIRKFSRNPFQVDDLIEFGTLTPPLANLLRLCVYGRLNVLITGGTGSGKTTLLNVLSSFIPEDQRIVSIEDAVELQLHQEHVIRLESRPPNLESKGEITIRDLVRNALRMRPDRIIVGEVRGAESLDMLQSMNTGHDGSLSTLHANSPRDALSRLETMVLMAGMDIPMRAIREQVASAIHLLVHLSRLADGSRRITSVTEVSGMEGQVVTLQDIFLFDFKAGVDREGRPRGTVQPTGIRPKFADRLAEMGLEIPAILLEGVSPPTQPTARKPN